MAWARVVAVNLADKLRFGNRFSRQSQQLVCGCEREESSATKGSGVCGWKDGVATFEMRKAVGGEQFSTSRSVGPSTQNF